MRSALSLRCMHPPLRPTRHHLRFVQPSQVHLYSSNRPSLPETHPLLTEHRPPHHQAPHSLLCPKHFAPGFQARDHSPFRSDPVLSHTCLPQNLPISGPPAPSTNPHVWGPTSTWCQTIHSFLAPTGTPHPTVSPLHLPGRSSAQAAPGLGRPRPQGCSPQRLNQQSIWHVHSTLPILAPSRALSAAATVGWGQREAAWTQLCPSVSLSFLICKMGGVPTYLMGFFRGVSQMIMMTIITTMTVFTGILCFIALHR